MKIENETTLPLDTWRTAIYDICQREFQKHALAQRLCYYHLLTFNFTIILLHVQQTGHLKDMFAFAADMIKIH